MMSRRSLAVLLVVTSLSLTACTPQELGEFFADQDLRTSEDPAEAAAGHAAEAISSDRTAQQLVTEGLSEKDEDKLQEAREHRPSDTRYAVYIAVLGLAGDGDYTRFMDRIYPSGRRYMSQGGVLDEQRLRDKYSEWLLVVMGSLDHALVVEHERVPIEPTRIERLEQVYCRMLSYQLSEYGAVARDVLNAMFLGESECDGVWESTGS